MTNWLIVGGSDSAPLFFDAAIDRVDAAGGRTITCNCGWQLFATRTARFGVRVPGAYWLSDAVACELFGRAARWVKHHGGRILTMQRSEAGLGLRGLDGLADELIDFQDGERDANCPQFVPGAYVHPRFSGLVCLQYAVNHAAPGGTVICVGMEGYRSTPEDLKPDTFDGRIGKPKGAAHTRHWIGPFTQSVVDARPDLRFVFCGKLRYPLVGDNVHLVREPAELEAAA